MKKWVFVLIFITSCTITSRVVYEPYSQIEVYFCPRDMCMEKIIDLVDLSTDIKCAFYDLDLEPLIDKLKQKDAEVIIEDKNALKIFSTGYSSALMHNKFCIFDNEIILTGSMNPTQRGNYYNNNNIVVIKSKYLAQNYLDEFRELKNNEYGTGKKVTYPIIKLGNTVVENYFCPEDNCKLQVINALKSANNSIYFMTYSFTDEDIGNLLYNKDYLGLDVKGILESKQISLYSRWQDLEKFSVKDNNKYTMHHKVFIIDEKIVVTGSYNPTKNANEKNDENILIIHSKEIASEFLEEFNRLYGFSEHVPNKTRSIILNKILYDAAGADKGNEYVELKNTADKVILLDYYFLSNNKTNSRLSSTIAPNQVMRIMPKFPLKNSEGLLILKYGDEIIDFVAWEGLWGLEAKSGELLMREDTSVISETAWSIEKI